MTDQDGGAHEPPRIPLTYRPLVSFLSYFWTCFTESLPTPPQKHQTPGCRLFCSEEFLKRDQKFQAENYFLFYGLLFPLEGVIFFFCKLLLRLFCLPEIFTHEHVVFTWTRVKQRAFGQSTLLHYNK